MDLVSLRVGSLAPCCSAASDFAINGVGTARSQWDHPQAKAVAKIFAKQSYHTANRLRRRFVLSSVLRVTVEEGIRGKERGDDDGTQAQGGQHQPDTNQRRDHFIRFKISSTRRRG